MIKHKLIDRLARFNIFKYGVMLSSYNEEWDCTLNKLLDSYDFTDISLYEAMLGKQCVWINNHPYASFEYHAAGITVRPSKATLSKAGRKLRKQLGMPLKSWLIKKSLS